MAKDCGTQRTREKADSIGSESGNRRQSGITAAKKILLNTSAVAAP